MKFYRNKKDVKKGKSYIRNSDIKKISPNKCVFHICHVPKCLLYILKVNILLQRFGVNNKD